MDCATAKHSRKVPAAQSTTSGPSSGKSDEACTASTCWSSCRWNLATASAALAMVAVAVTVAALRVAVAVAVPVGAVVSTARNRHHTVAS